MELNIVEITQKISVSTNSVLTGWPSFVSWLSNQIPRRTIIGYFDSDGDLRGWKDDWTQKGKTDYSRKKTFEPSVLSTEIIGLLKAPPISLSTEEAIAIREYLIDMGLLVANRFYKSNPCDSIIQFRI